MPESSTETSGSQPKQPEKYSVKPRWAIPQRLDFMTFIGKDVLAVAQDVEIIFFNLKTNTETVYVANNAKCGDGVDCIAGHRTTIFAFSEKIMHPRIFIVAYPSLTILNELKDMEVNRYKGICMCESDTVAAFSGFPNYLVSVWSWRTGQRLLQLPTDVVRRQQIYMSSRTHLLICQCWGEGLTVWEVAQCYKKCLMMKRTKQETTGWEVSEPPLVGVCWSNEGQLYAIDPKGNLYCLLSDGIGMVRSLEWSAEDIPGNNKPCICSFGNGLLIYGPDNYLRALKKCEDKWKISSSFAPLDTVARLVSNSSSDTAAMWTVAGCVYRITGDEEKMAVAMATFKQRNVKKIQMIAPEYDHIAMIDNRPAIGIYEVLNGKLVAMKFVEGQDVSFQASPVDPLLVVFGKVGKNYGMKLLAYGKEELHSVISVCLTHQIVSRAAFSPTGRSLVAAAMSAGHIFIYSLSPAPEYKLELVRYAELGRGLADCFLMRVGDAMRCFSLVLFSDKYPIGERIICINADTGRDNKFAGKMQGPYARLLPLRTPDAMLAVPHLSRSYHLLKLSGDKGVTVSVKMGPIIDSGHDLKLFNGFYNVAALLTFGYDGAVILREPHAPEEIELKLVASHRYDKGIIEAAIDSTNQVIVTLAGNKTVVVFYLHQDLAELQEEARLEPPAEGLLDEANNTLSIISVSDKNYLDLQEDKKVHEETMDYRKQRDEVVKNFETIREKLVELLEENLRERPLHQLSLAEFNLHMEHKKERLKQAEKEREEIRLKTDQRIKAQDKVAAWIKKTCWDTMITPRVKLFAMFTHYQVENYAVLPTQMSNWPELQQVEAIRTLEMENDSQLLRPWEEPVAKQSFGSLVSTVKLPVQSTLSIKDRTTSQISQRTLLASLMEDSVQGEPYVLSGSYAHKFIQPPAYSIPQTLTFSFMHMYYIQHIARLNIQNMRLWFNKQFDELVGLKKREMSLVEDRNARLRFIVEELNKLSDLRGSFHHLVIQITDPEWRQEEQPLRLIKVGPEECAIEPYISPSQIVIIPPDPGPKDDFRERALIEMMDGVLEKLWHEEIKKPIPKPQCMLDKDPEHFNEDDLRLVFDYEAKVAFRNEERDKYRKMLHAEYAKLSAILNEGIVKFNQKVKEMWLTKLQVDSVIGQETLNLMRLRRVNLDRVEMAEALEELRATKYRFENEIEFLKEELEEIQGQGNDCQSMYDALSLKDKHMEKTFKNHFADLSPVIVDQCYKYYKKRPKWHQRAAMTPAVLYDLANAVLTGVRQPFMHPDCLEYSRALDQLDLVVNMPAVMDEPLWVSTVKLRRAKVENEIRMRAIVQEMAYVDSASNVWNKAIMARRHALARTNELITEHRATVELTARNKTLQIVLPAGQVEITTSGHMVDYEDATLILRSDIEAINDAILKVGEMKLRMMRKQMEFRKGILSKEWEHAQWRMRLRHCEQELYSYRRLKIPKELQRYLKDKELGYTDEQDFVRMEKEMEASKVSVMRVLNQQVRRVEETEMKIKAIEGYAEKLEDLISTLNVKVSEKRLNEDPLEPIRVRKIYKKRMESLVQRSQLIREVQANHTSVVLLQTELELLRLKTYPTLASFQTFQ